MATEAEKILPTDTTEERKRRQPPRLRVIVGGAVALAFMLADTAPVAARDLVGPAQVIDGDSLVVGGQQIRLQGVDVPEWDQPCNLPDGSEWFPGREATAWLKSIVEGRLIACTPEDRDRYKRLVATCYIDGRNINEALISEGWAFPYLKYSQRYARAGNQAQIEKRGIHRGMCIQPSMWRQSNGGRGG